MLLAYAVGGVFGFRTRLPFRKVTLILPRKEKGLPS